MATIAATHATPRAGTYEEIDGVLYPCVEETPVVQSDWHDDAVFEVKGMLRAHFAGRPEVYIGSDMFVFWARGMPWKHQAPDIFVCPDAEPHGNERKSYCVWRERSGPHFILEVLSDSTEEDDWGKKFATYRDQMRVPEYFVLDPHLRRCASGATGSWGESMRTSLPMSAGAFGASAWASGSGSMMSATCACGQPPASPC